MSGLPHQLIRVTSRDIVVKQEHMVMLGKRNAERQVATFMCRLGDRYGRLSRDSQALILPMPRADIANYLGLALETVGRLFSHMEAAGVLAVNRKSVHILRRDLLDELCDHAAKN